MFSETEFDPAQFVMGQEAPAVVLTSIVSRTHYATSPFLAVQHEPRRRAPAYVHKLKVQRETARLKKMLRRRIPIDPDSP